MSPSAEYSIEIRNETQTDFHLRHAGVDGQTARTHQKPSPVLKAGSTEYLSWNVGNDRFTLSRAHAYWFANETTVFAIHMNGYDNGQQPYTAYQYSTITGTGDGCVGPYNWIRSGEDWGKTYQFCFAGPGGQKYKVVVKNDPQDPETRVSQTVAITPSFRLLWPGSSTRSS